VRNVTRRTALGVIGAVGGLAATRTEGQHPQSYPFDLPPIPAVLRAEPSGSQVGVGVCGRMTGAAAAVEALMLEGTPCVFGIPGAQNNDLWDAMKSKRLPYLLCTHEFSASVMADGAARATGRVGVFAVIPGPGLTNSLTGIGEARLDSVPLVGLVTDIAHGPNARAFQVHALPTAALLRPVCKLVLEVRHVSRIPLAIHQAFQVARAGEPGPVAVVIPFDLYRDVWCYQGELPAPLPRPLDEAAYRHALGLLADPSRSGRVGIYAGMGCHDHPELLRAVAETLQAPVATSVSGKGALDDRHPLAVGWGYGRFGTRTAENAFRKVDTVLAIGVKYSEVSTANYSIPPIRRVIHVDAEPANLGRNVAADVAVHADSGRFLERLLSDSAAIRREDDPGLRRRIAQDRALDRACHEAAEITQAVDPMRLFVELRRQLHPEDLIYLDVTASTHWAAESLWVPGPRRYFAPSDNQSMGWSIPAAIAAQAVRPEVRVISVAGDGCFLMSGLETSTAAREGLPVKFLVLDDGAYHYMQMLQQPLYRRTTATQLAPIDYAAFAHAMGLAYLRIGTNDQVPGSLHSGLNYPGPILIHVHISYKGRELRWLSALRTSYLDKLDTPEKLRLGTRVAVRSVKPFKVND